MPSPYDPILTSVGLLNDKKLTKQAKDRYVDEVVALLLTGNVNGRGGSPTTKIFNTLVPLPPIAGPTIFNPTTLAQEHVFWFETDPISAIVALLLKEPKNCPLWHVIFSDILYEKTAVALDLLGATPLFPIFDVSVAFDVDLPIPFTLPDLALKLNLKVPDLTLKLKDLKIQLALPSIPFPPIPPQLPTIDLGVPPLILPELLIGLIRLPFDLLLRLVLPPSIDLVLPLNLPNLPALVLDLAINITLQLLIDLNLLLIVPKVFIASLLIYLKNVVAIVCTDIVGLLLGAGNIAKGVAALTGLI